MTDNPRPDPDDFPDVDPWVIPLTAPPTSADAGAPPIFGVVGPGADDPGPPPPFPAEDELPTEGFHPRLRRSA